MTAPRIEHEWYGRPLPDNISVGENVYLESSYCFTRFFSKREPGLVMESTVAPRAGFGSTGLPFGASFSRES